MRTPENEQPQLDGKQWMMHVQLAHWSKMLTREIKIFSVQILKLVFRAASHMLHVRQSHKNISAKHVLAFLVVATSTDDIAVIFHSHLHQNTVHAI